MQPAAISSILLEPSLQVLWLCRSALRSSTRPEVRASAGPNDGSADRTEQAGLTGVLQNRYGMGVAAAVVPTPVHRVALNVASLFSRRRFTAFTSRETALEWLSKQ